MLWDLPHFDFLLFLVSTMKEIIIQSVPGLHNITLSFSFPPTGAHIMRALSTSLPENSSQNTSLFDSIYLSHGIHVVTPEDIFTDSQTFLSMKFRLIGGKQGAYGQTLKRKKLTSQRIVSLSKCKDLSGRRIADLKLAKYLKEWEETHKNQPVTPPSDTTRKQRFLTNNRRAATLERFDSQLKNITESVADSMEAGITDELNEEKQELFMDKVEQPHTTLSSPETISAKEHTQTIEQDNSSDFSFDQFSFD